MTRKLELERTRNFGIIAHVDAGKTTLTERLLFYTGSIHRAGNVDEGNTKTDHRPEERQKGITITAAAVSCSWRDHRLQLIDTPGHVDFAIEVECALRVLDGAVVVLDGVAGVEPQTEAVWRQADRHGVPRMCFVNKLDRVGADFDRCVREIRERLGARPVVVTFPRFDADGTLTGVIDLVEERELAWTSEDGRVFDTRPIPAELTERASSLRNALIDVCASVDASFERAFLESGVASPESLRAALRGAVAGSAIVPVFGGSAFRNRGVQPLLDAIVDLLPSPEADPNGPCAAFCFKVEHDPFGQLSYVRVYSGRLRTGDSLWSARDERALRVRRLVRIFADAREDVTEAIAGDIVGLLGLSLANGDTLSDPDHRTVLEPVEVPDPVVRVAIEPVTRDDHDRMGPAFGKLLAEDPSVRVSTDPDTGQTLMAGMGELHIEMSVSRLSTAHNVRVSMGRPQVAYRETIRAMVEEDVVHRKQTGGPGEFAHVRVRFAPAERGAGLVFHDRTRGGVVPSEWVPAIRKGIALAMTRGITAGHPVVDVVAELLDGSTHTNDSSELAFHTAGSLAFARAAPRARPAVLEPIVRVEVDVPEAHLGDVLGDLGKRRARVLTMGERGHLRVVGAEAPLAEMFGYVGDLRSLTHGRGTFAMRADRYEVVPDALASKLR